MNLKNTFKLPSRRRAIKIGGIGLALGVVVGLLLALPVIDQSAAHRVSYNESFAIGTLRTLYSAEQIFQGTNGGLFGTMECLEVPFGCIPGYPTNAPSMLHPGDLSTPIERGYIRTFYPGAPASPADILKHKAATSSLTGFAFVAVPERDGITGSRSFCVDASGVVCQIWDGSAPEIEDARCPSSCDPLNY